MAGPRSAPKRTLTFARRRDRTARRDLTGKSRSTDIRRSEKALHQNFPPLSPFLSIPAPCEFQTPAHPHAITGGERIILATCCVPANPPPPIMPSVYLRKAGQACETKLPNVSDPNPGPIRVAAGLPDRLPAKIENFTNEPNIQPHLTEIKSVPAAKANPNSDPNPGPIRAAAGLPDRLLRQNRKLHERTQYQPYPTEIKPVPSSRANPNRTRLPAPHRPATARCLARSPAEIENCMNEPLSLIHI